MRKKFEIEIVSVKYLKKYILKISFSDGHESIVNFEDFILTSNNSDITKFKNKNLFKKYQIVDGDLMWGDFEMLFPIIDLYDGHISNSNNLAA